MLLLLGQNHFSVEKMLDFDVFMNQVLIKTRPDTRPPVADGWAGAEMRVSTLSNSITTDRPTDRPTNGRTDGQSLLQSRQSVTKTSNMILQEKNEWKPLTKWVQKCKLFNFPTLRLNTLQLVHVFFLFFLPLGHATLHFAVLVGMSVGPLVGHIFELQVYALLLLPTRPRLDCRVSGLVVFHS